MSAVNTISVQWSATVSIQLEQKLLSTLTLGLYIRSTIQSGPKISPV